MRTEIIKVTLTGIAMWAAGCYTGPLDDGGRGGAGQDTDADDDGGGGDGAGDDDAGGSDGGSADGGTAGGDDGGGPPQGCIPGSVGCECLDDTCLGLSTCIENMCTPAPPLPQVEGPTGAIAGVTILLEGTVEGGDDNDDINLYELLLWEQLDGPAATLSSEYSDQTRVYIPGNAADDMELVFRLTASLGEVDTSTDYALTIIPPEPAGVIDDAVDVLALGATVMSRGGDGTFWIGNPTGTFARVADGAIAYSEELGSRITALRGFNNNLTLIALPDLQEVHAYNANNNTIEPFLTQLSGGGALGPVSTIATFDGDAYFGAEDGTIVYYDSPDDAEPEVTLSLLNIGSAPTVLAIGDVPVPPDVDEGDEGVVLYAGTAAGDIVQVGLTAVEIGEGPPLGEATAYLTVPGTGPVTGLTVDAFGNMWVAKGDTLHLVRRLYEEAPTIVRTIDAPAGLRGFAGLSRDGDNNLAWLDPTTSRIATLTTVQN